MFINRPEHFSFPMSEETKKEAEPVVRMEVYTAKELEHVVFDEHSEPKDRFKSPREGGVFKLFYPDMLLNKREPESHFVLLMEGDTVAAIGKFRKCISYGPDSQVFATSVSVDPAYQGRGYGKMVKEKQFQVAKERGWKMDVMYTDEGRQRLKKYNRQFAKKYGVELIEDPIEKLVYDDPDEDDLNREVE